jgi:hypothetical protein
VLGISRAILIDLLKSLRSIFGEWSPEEKEGALAMLVCMLLALADNGDSEAIRS